MADDDDKITQLPGTAFTAQTLMRDMALDTTIEQVIAVVTRKDGSMQVAYNATTPQDIAMASVILHDAAIKAAMGQDADREAVRGNPYKAASQGPAGAAPTCDRCGVPIPPMKPCLVETCRFAGVSASTDVAGSLDRMTNSEVSRLVPERSKPKLSVVKDDDA